MASFTVPPFEEEAPVFRSLAESYELCVLGLSRVGEDLRRLEDSRIRDAMELL